ncbi:MAG: iron-sulfur cluster assembly protein [Bacteroidota bacterium]
MVKKKHVLYDSIVATLQDIYDPELPVDIYSLGLIYNITIEDTDDQESKVGILMTLTTPNCPAMALIVEDIKEKVIAIKGVGSVGVQITFDPPYSPDNMSEEAKIALGWLD